MARRSGTGGAAEECAVARARRPRLRRVEKFTRLLVAVNAGFDARWSPHQIATRLKVDHPRG
jgi:IS30 family transposase